ncbi:UNVERIFIED_CONTAM: hypothetical protein Sradi_0491000 [Sesamum radiatum]|uniref:Reverse transcriptase Ty1/copia-type domain-containing protein n=1 Tax=Sesamum radiatum TaxID=300843 RepID=A0AAW2WCM8_SESRA
MAEMTLIQSLDKPSDITHPLRKSARVSKQLERYGMLALTGQLDNNLKMFEEAMYDIDLGRWLEAMRSEMDTRSNKVWTLVDPPKGVRSVGCKWVYKRKLGADGEVSTFKARLVQKVTLKYPGWILRKPIRPS